MKNASELVNKELNNNEQLWAVINNAGVGSIGVFEWTELQEYRRTFEINFFGVIRVTKAFLPLIRASRGRIVNIASKGGMEPQPQMGVYGSSKAALINLDKVLRREMHMFDVKVITVLPFFYSTNIVAYESNKTVLAKQWESISEQLRADYGLSWLNSYMSFLKHNSFCGLFNTNLSQVSTAVNSAITLSEPEVIKRKPCIHHLS